MAKKKNRFRKFTKKEEEEHLRFSYKTNQYEGQSTDQLMKTAMSRDLPAPGSVSVWSSMRVDF